MSIEELSGDAVWVAEDVRRRCSSSEVARFSFEFSGERARAAARMLLASGFCCLRTKGSPETLTVEAPTARVPWAVGICLEYEGRYLRTSSWPSS